MVVVTGCGYDAHARLGARPPGKRRGEARRQEERGARRNGQGSGGVGGLGEADFVPCATRRDSETRLTHGKAMIMVSCRWLTVHCRNSLLQIAASNAARHSVDVASQSPAAVNQTLWKQRSAAEDSREDAPPSSHPTKWPTTRARAWSLGDPWPGQGPCAPQSPKRHAARQLEGREHEKARSVAGGQGRGEPTTCEKARHPG